MTIEHAYITLKWYLGAQKKNTLCYKRTIQFNIVKTLKPNATKSNVG